MGVFEEAKGKAKQKAGEALDKPELVEEGRAQAKRGEEERKAAQARAEAKAREAKADAEEVRQRMAQHSK